MFTVGDDCARLVAVKALLQRKICSSAFSNALRALSWVSVVNIFLLVFLCGTGVKLHRDTIDELIVKRNEDTWHIKMDSQGTYSLYHNNYVMVCDEERYITSGFHPQKHHPPYLPGILAYIQAYDWQKYLEFKHFEYDASERCIEKLTKFKRLFLTF